MRSDWARRRVRKWGRVGADSSPSCGPVSDVRATHRVTTGSGRWGPVSAVNEAADYLPGDSGECLFAENLLSSLSVEGNAPQWPLSRLLSMCIGLTRLTPSALFAEVPADQVPRSEVGGVQGVREGEQTHRQQAARPLPAARWASRASALPGWAVWCGVRQPACETKKHALPALGAPRRLPFRSLQERGLPEDGPALPMTRSSPVACPAPRAAGAVLVCVSRVLVLRGVNLGVQRKQAERNRNNLDSIRRTTVDR